MIQTFDFNIVPKSLSSIKFYLIHKFIQINCYNLHHHKSQFLDSKKNSLPIKLWIISCKRINLNGFYLFI
jgi:hypothetical protein